MPLFSVPRAVMQDLSRRSTLVMATKRSLIAAVLLILLVVGWMIFHRPAMERFTLSSQSVGVNKNLQPVMEKPRFQGVDGELRPYTVTADAALQKDADTVELTKMQGDITLSDGGWVSMLADFGIMKVEAKHLTLNGNIQFFHDAGYSAQTNAMQLDLLNNRVSGSVPVQAQGPAGTLKAGAFEADTKNRWLRFTNHVEVVIIMEPRQ
jgi:lipopolysaccharide export system protein LptC